MDIGTIISCIVVGLQIGFVFGASVAFKCKIDTDKENEKWAMK